MRVSAMLSGLAPRGLCFYSLFYWPIFINFLLSTLTGGSSDQETLKCAFFTYAKSDRDDMLRWEAGVTTTLHLACVPGWNWTPGAWRKSQRLLVTGKNKHTTLFGTWSAWMRHAVIIYCILLVCIPSVIFSHHTPPTSVPFGLVEEQRASPLS